MSLLLSLLLALPTAQAEDARGPWKTLETAHYRLHYPVAAEAWALEAGARLEAIRAVVSAEVGYAPDQRVDIVVLDPANRANGFALPLQRHPRMGVYPTAPSPDSGLGNFRSWYEDLLTHEDAHLAHLLRPSRNKALRLAGDLTGLGPLLFTAPRWVMEGYATVIEGKLTGSGRPSSDARAGLLRVLAVEGKLPSYAGMSSSGAYLGGSYAYLFGSAYLEWLEARAGEGALRDLWARSTAREVRSFDDAFEGVFQDSPANLYARFKAELTAKALAAESARPPADDTLWLNLKRSTGAPALSHDGAQLALMVDSKRGPARLKVYSTAEDTKARDKWQAKVTEALAADPADVAPKPPRAFPREAAHTRAAGQRRPEGPRWMPGDKALLYAAWEPRDDGTTRPDLFTWEIAADRERRVTRGADVYDPDPHPDGTWAVAMRQRWGANQLVRVELASGQTTDLTPADVNVLVSTPRFSPDGATLAWLRHSGAWRVRLRDLKTNEERDLPLPEDAAVLDLSWAPAGDALLLSLGQGGFIEVYRAPLDGGPLTRLTQTAGGAFAPVLSPDGASLYYLSPDAEGLDLYRRAVVTPLPAVAEPLPDLAPVTRFTRASPPPPPAAPTTVAPTPYGLGRPELRPLVGGAAGPSVGRIDAGLRAGDLVGRWELLLLGQRDEVADAWGATLGLTSRALPVTLGLDAWGTTASGAGRGGGALSVSRSGTPRWSRYQADLSAFGEGGAAVTGPGGPAPYGAAGSLSGGHTWGQGKAWFDLEAGATGDVRLGGGPSAGLRGGAWAGLGLGLGPVGLTLGGQGDRARSGATLALGGALDALLPDAVEAGRIADPALAAPVPDAASARLDAHQSLRLALGIPDAFELYGERRWLGAAPLGGAGTGSGTGSGKGTDRVTTLGLHTRTAVPRQPLMRMPETRFDAGVACVLDAPDLPARAAPCQGLSDWAAWASVGWGL